MRTLSTSHVRPLLQLSQYNEIQLGRVNQRANPYCGTQPHTSPRSPSHVWYKWKNVKSASSHVFRYISPFIPLTNTFPYFCNYLLTAIPNMYIQLNSVHTRGQGLFLNRLFNPPPPLEVEIRFNPQNLGKINNYYPQRSIMNHNKYHNLWFVVFELLLYKFACEVDRYPVFLFAYPSRMCLSPSRLQFSLTFII